MEHTEDGTTAVLALAERAGQLLVRASENAPGSTPAEQAGWMVAFAVMGGIATACTLAVIAWKVAKPHVDKYLSRVVRQVADVHRSVTVNGGRNDPPTLLDEIGKNTAEVRLLRIDLAEHMAFSERDRAALWRAVGHTDSRPDEREG